MSRTRFKSGDRRDMFLYHTSIENLFINEFLPDAPGDFVKVFVFGLMCAQVHEEVDSRTLALTLGLTEKDVDNAWKYWESKGLIRLEESKDDDSYGIEFIRQIDLFYGKGGDDDNEESSGTYDAEDGADAIIARLVNQQLKEIFDKYNRLTGRTISRHEVSKLTDAVKVFGIEPDVLDFAIDYCVGIDKYSVDYICSVARRWADEGCTDVAQVKVMLDRHSKRNEFYRMVFGALGFTRIPNPADREMMDKWVDEMGMTVNDVMEGCRAAVGLRDPNLRYVNKVLENMMLERGGVDTRQAQTAQKSQPAGAAADPDGSAPQARVSQKVLRDYYEYIRSEEERARASRTDEVIRRIPEIGRIDAKIAELNRRVTGLSPGPDTRQLRRQLREKRTELEDEKKSLLVRGGYPDNYLERSYRCSKCRDTGYTDEGRVCTCCRERAEEAYRWIRETGRH